MSGGSRDNLGERGRDDEPSDAAHHPEKHGKMDATSRDAVFRGSSRASRPIPYYGSQFWLKYEEVLSRQKIVPRLEAVTGEPHLVDDLIGFEAEFGWRALR